MRGLLIDRRFGQARLVWQCDPWINRLDSGSFLAHAVMNGIVTNLRWVHDDFGGRKYDDLYCVKYETDLSALPFRLAGRGKWVPLTFKEQTFAEWDGPHPGEHLCIDWDAIANIEYGETKIRRLMSEFLNRELKVGCVFVARSPDYCCPDRSLFEDFVSVLEKKLNVQAQRITYEQHSPAQPSMAWNIYHQIEYRILRQMRKWGVY
jgi:hypothetical protein